MRGLDSSFRGGVMDLSGKTILVVMSDPTWLVGPKLKHAGANLLLADSLAAGQQTLRAVDTGIDALVVGLRLSDGFCGPLIREARYNPHPCAALVCMTDPAGEAVLVPLVLLEGPWDLIELPRESSRLIRAVEATVQRTQVMRGWLRLSIDGRARPTPGPSARDRRRDTDRQIVAAAQALAAPEQVTDEELEMLRELAAGHGPAEIASRAGKSPETVRSQLRSVRLKTRTQSLVGLLSAVFGRAFCDTPTDPELPAPRPESRTRSPKSVKRN